MLAAQLLLELSKQDDSRELIIADGCIPHIINRTNDVHCGEDAASILLELSISPQTVGRILHGDTFGALIRSLRDTDTITWKPTLCMALVNAIEHGTSHLETMSVEEVLLTCQGLVTTMLWNLAPASTATHTSAIVSSDYAKTRQQYITDRASAPVPSENASSCGGEGSVPNMALLEEALPKGEWCV